MVIAGESSGAGGVQFTMKGAPTRIGIAQVSTATSNSPQRNAGDTVIVNLPLPSVPPVPMSTSSAAPEPLQVPSGPQSKI